MANKTVEMDFWLHLMLSLSCQAPGLSVLCSCPRPFFLPFAPLVPAPLLWVALWGICPFINDF